ncbi:3867_t:CDS:2 [Diversispora eburnea]|uniref:3867_t:CDS:1 n=1 Tax=Diversispora eburnea TaxID=1213867 RepID=A0A9N8VXJ0_9GLOM|nr:3867_t:CDS:2 [Diversispora eburnea]
MSTSQKTDPPLMLSSSDDKQNQQSNVPASPPPPYPQQSFSSMSTDDASRGVPPQGYAEPSQPQVVYIDQPQHTQQPSQTIIMQQAPQFVNITSPSPVRITCPYCSNDIVTTVAETPGSTAYILAGILCCIFWPLMWLPCVMSGCLDKIHSCPICRGTLATVRA